MLIPQIVWGQLLLETLISCVRWSYRSISCPFCFCSVYYLRMSRIILCWPMQWYWRKPAFVLFSFISNNCISPATWRPCAAVIAMELSSVEILSDSQLQEGKMPRGIFYKPFWYHQSFSETFGSDLFCLLTGDFFCVPPPAAKTRQRNATGGCDLTFSSEPGSLTGENEKCGTWRRNLPQHIRVHKVKSWKDVYKTEVPRLPLCTFCISSCTKQLIFSFTWFKWLIIYQNWLIFFIFSVKSIKSSCTQLVIRRLFQLEPA